MRIVAKQFWSFMLTQILNFAVKINIVTWSFLPFAVDVILNFPNMKFKTVSQNTSCGRLREVVVYKRFQ